jgi:hypothetical protein
VKPFAPGFGGISIANVRLLRHKQLRTKKRERCKAIATMLTTITQVMLMSVCLRLIEEVKTAEYLLAGRGLDLDYSDSIL